MCYVALVPVDGPIYGLFMRCTVNGVLFGDAHISSLGYLWYYVTFLSELESNTFNRTDAILYNSTRDNSKRV